MYKERLLLVLKSGIHKPIKRLCLTASKHPLQSTTIVDPSCYSEASTNSEWHHAMDDEINAFLCNGTWTLVPAKQNYNFIGCKWVFRTKTIADDKTERRKAHLVAKQFNQQPGIDFGETFNLVINPCTIRLVLTIALYHNWPLRQLDVQNTFLNGELTEDVYMKQPPGYAVSRFPNHVFRLRKSIYGLRQSFRA